MTKQKSYTSEFKFKVAIDAKSSEAESKLKR